MSSIEPETRFIFDVDGTLTPSRGIIDKKFEVFFTNFCRSNNVYLVTGSDKPKTVEQLGKEIYNKCKRVYNCNGNDVWEGDVNVRQNHWVLEEEVSAWLSSELTSSTFPLRTGLHFEHRPGMVNFSIVGRNATLGERKLYVEYDEKNKERERIAYNFNTIFPELEAKVGGETGIDIAPKGADKSQILTDFDKEDKIYFFGDRCDVDGNDFPLAQKVQNPKHVTSWTQTWEYLSWFQEQRIAN